MSPSARAALLVGVRYVLPGVLIAVGFLLLAFAPESVRWEGWAGCVGAGLSIWLLNWFYRVGSKGDEERRAEEAARDYFSEHGRWPDEDDPKIR